MFVGDEASARVRSPSAPHFCGGYFRAYTEAGTAMSKNASLVCPAFRGVALLDFMPR
jgi:hypothetical protein